MFIFCSAESSSCITNQLTDAIIMYNPLQGADNGAINHAQMPW